MRHDKVIGLLLMVGMGGCVEKASFPMPSSPNTPAIFSPASALRPSLPLSPTPFASPPTLAHNSPHLVLGNPSGAGNDPNNLLLLKPQYALSYNTSRGTANWASWQLSKEWIGNVKRTDDFRPDEQLPLEMQISPRDYSRSGYDRGHLVPAADRDRSIEDVSSTFVMSNMVPQTPDLNRGAWADFEAYCRELAMKGHILYIMAGPVGNLTFPVKLSNPDAATRTTVTPLSVKRVRVKWMYANFHRGSMMNSSTLKNFSSCQLGDARLNSRALEIGQALSLQYGQPLSQVFPSKKKLKRAYEFFANPKTDLKKVAEPHWKATTCSMTGLKTVLAVGDTTYLDYKKIIKKREEYGPIGNGGNGLILQSTFFCRS